MWGWLSWTSRAWFSWTSGARKVNSTKHTESSERSCLCLTWPLTCTLGDHKWIAPSTSVHTWHYNVTPHSSLVITCDLNSSALYANQAAIRWTWKSENKDLWHMSSKTTVLTVNNKQNYLFSIFDCIKCLCWEKCCSTIQTDAKCCHWPPVSLSFTPVQVRWVKGLDIRGKSADVLGMLFSLRHVNL